MYQRPHIYIVTHGEKGPGPDPGLTTKGREQIASLTSLLPEKPGSVLCGTGRRHLETAAILGLKPTQYSSVFGGPESLEIRDKERRVRFASGATIPEDEFMLQEPWAKNFITHLNLLYDKPYSIVILAGRPFMIMLGYHDAKSGVIYERDRFGSFKELVPA